MIGRLALYTAVIAALGAAQIGAAQGNGGEVAMRGPRFLLASASGNVPLDVTRAPVLALRLSLQLNGVTRKQALAEISRQAGLKLVYGDDMLGLDGRVQLRADSITVAAALTDVLWDAGLDVVLSANKQVALVRRPKGAALPQAGVLTGRITEANTGRGVVGAEVFLNDTKWRTVSDTAGRYQLADIEAGSYRLTARKVGYGKQSRQITVEADRVDTVDITLAPAAVALDELITTATGQQRRRDIGNAITTIRADSVLQSAPIRSLTDLLENRVPGLTVQHTSGAPGDPARLRLRGLGSVMRGNDPVVIVDGVRIYAAQSEERSGNLTNLGCQNIVNGVCTSTGLVGNTGLGGPLPAPSPLDQIDPNIIEKIEVFKGPSAATLYGADAANGVIVVTTKRGRPGPARWDASLTYGRTTAPGRWPVGYYSWGAADSFSNIPSFCPTTSLCQRLDSLVQFQALNDPEMTILGQGRRTALSLTTSGGNQALTYSVTGTYDTETGLLQLPALGIEQFRTRFNREAPDWMRRPHHLEKWSVRSGITARLGPTADVTLLTTLARTEQRRTQLESRLPIFAGTYIDQVNGIYYRSDFGYVNGTTTVVPILGIVPIGGGPLGSGEPALFDEFYTRTTASTINFTTGLNATWHPRSWFTASGQGGLNVIPRDDQRLLPAGLSADADSGSIIHGTGRSVIGTFNVQGAVRKPLRWGFNLETNIGFNLTTTSTADLVSSASKLAPGTSTISRARLITATESRTETSIFGWYIEPRLAGQRLSLSTGIRLDGGSTHGARLTRTGGLGNLLSLPKLNGSWVISEEPFFPFKSLFSSLRLRAAYGQAQVQPGPADRLRLYTGQVENRLQLDRVGNTELRPERSVEFEGGFDADLLNSRVSVELAAYQKTQVDALMPVQLPPSVNGGGLVMQNIGNIRNRGLELTVGLLPVQTPVLTWSARLTYSRNVNTLVKLGRGVAANKEQGLVAGYPVAGRWARPILGYADQNGNEILERQEIQLGDSLVFMGRLLPDYATVLNTDLVLFGGAVGISAGFNYESGATQIDQTARTNWVLVQSLSDPSAPFSEQAAVLASLGEPGVNRTDYGLMQDVSTFRFHSLSVNYRVPSRVAQLLRAQQLTIAVQGSNLGLHTTYRGKDPDVNSWSAGEGVMDTGQLPLPRTWQLAVFLKY